MRIKLTKHAHIGQSVYRKGWEGEVTQEQGESVINAGRGEEVKSGAAKKVAKKKVAEPKTLADEL